MTIKFVVSVLTNWILVRIGRNAPNSAFWQDYLRDFRSAYERWKENY